VQLRRRDWSRRGGGEVRGSDRWGFERLSNGNGHNRSGTPWRRPRGSEVGKEGGDSFLTVTKGVVVAAYMADDMADSAT